MSWEKTNTVSDNTIKAESLGDFFKILGRMDLRYQKKMARTVLKKSRKSFGNWGANVRTAFAIRSLKRVLPLLPEVINFYHTGIGLYLGKRVEVFCLNKWLPFL